MKKDKESKGIQSHISVDCKTAKNNLNDHEMNQPNFDLAANKMVGYAHIQKHNLFHQVNREPEYKI